MGEGSACRLGRGTFTGRAALSSGRREFSTICFLAASSLFGNLNTNPLGDSKTLNS